MADFESAVKNADDVIVNMVESKIHLKPETNNDLETMTVETFEMHVEQQTNVEPEKNVGSFEMHMEQQKNVQSEQNVETFEMHVEQETNNPFEKTSNEAAKAETAAEVEKAMHKKDNCRNIVFVVINIILGVIVFGLQVNCCFMLSRLVIKYR